MLEKELNYTITEILTEMDLLITQGDDVYPIELKKQKYSLSGHKLKFIAKARNECNARTSRLYV